MEGVITMAFEFSQFVQVIEISSAQKRNIHCGEVAGIGATHHGVLKLAGEKRWPAFDGESVVEEMAIARQLADDSRLY